MYHLQFGNVICDSESFLLEFVMSSFVAAYMTASSSVRGKYHSYATFLYFQLSYLYVHQHEPSSIRSCKLKVLSTAVYNRLSITLHISHGNP